MNEHMNGAQLAWQRKLDEGEFSIQFCDACERYVFFPRLHCPHCGGVGLRWRPSAELGTVYSVTTVRRSVEDGGDYNVSLVDLDEGVRLMSRVEAARPQDVAIGMRVKARISNEDGRGLVVFGPAGEAGGVL